MNEPDTLPGKEARLPDEVEIVEADAPKEIIEKTEGIPADEAAEETPDAGAEPPKKSKGVQKRIDELTGNWRSAERDRDYWRDLALQKKEEPAQTVTETPPKPDDFDDYADFISAQASFTVKQELATANAVESKREAEKEAGRKKTQALETFDKQVHEARGRYDDFDAVVFDPSVPINDAMVAVISQSEQGADIAYHLGTNPAEAQRIARMEPLAAARELGRIEYALSAPRKTTNAPKPAAVINRGGVSDPDPEKMDIPQYRKYRKYEPIGN